jgi:hypothetical protein
LWILPKKARAWVSTVISLIDFFIAGLSKDEVTTLTRDVAPCIRLLPNGYTELINCKTGEVIKAKG